MIQLSVIVTNEKGIHARPSKSIVDEAEKYKCKLLIKKKNCNIEADCHSILSLLMLGVSFNEEIIIKADGPDEQIAAEAIYRLISSLNY